ncbi:MAG: hypothetical protein ABIA74_06005 [bacterium]
MTEENKLNSADAIAEEIFFILSSISSLKELIEQSNSKFEIYKEYSDFFYSYYVNTYNEIYHSISKLTDNRKDVISLIKLLEKKQPEDKEISNLLQKIKKHPITEKIKNKRNNLLAHKNKSLALDKVELNNFYEKNKTNLNEIKELTLILKRGLDIYLEGTTIFYNSKEATQIKKIFEKLSINSKI